MRLLKKIPVHPTFILLVIWFIIAGKLPNLLLFTTVVLSHELGHAFVAKRLGYKLNAFYLAPYGVSLNYQEKAFEPVDEIKIALAGPCVNFLLAILIVCFWWLVPGVYGYTRIFVEQSVMLGLFNLLPAYPMDGGRVCVGISNAFLPRKKAVKITRVFNLLFSGIFLVLFIISCKQDFNPTFALAACFMFGGLFQSGFESKYQPMQVFKKKIKNFSKAGSCVIHAALPLGKILRQVQPNKFTVFYVLFADGRTKIIDENTLMRLSLRYPYTETLETIFSKPDKATRSKTKP